MWGVQIRHITAAQTLSGLTLCVLNVGLSRSQPLPSLLPGLLNHAKPRGDCVTERKLEHSNRVREDILPSLSFGDPLLLGRGAGMELLNRPVTGDK
jgi:hypothetical protein